MRFLPSGKSTPVEDSSASALPAVSDIHCCDSGVLKERREIRPGTECVDANQLALSNPHVSATISNMADEKQMKENLAVVRANAA